MDRNNPILDAAAQIARRYNRRSRSRSSSDSDFKTPGIDKLFGSTTNSSEFGTDLKKLSVELLTNGVEVGIDVLRNTNTDEQVDLE